MTIKDVVTSKTVKALGVILLGALGMGLFRIADSLVRDWLFMHQVRVETEQQQETLRVMKMQQQAAQQGATGK